MTGFGNRMRGTGWVRGRFIWEEFLAPGSLAIGIRLTVVVSLVRRLSYRCQSMSIFDLFTSLSLFSKVFFIIISI